MAYSESYFTIRETWRDWRIEARELMRLARVRRGVRVLEIGCGGGGLLRMLCARGAYAVGVDTSESALCLARECLSAGGQRKCRGQRGRGAGGNLPCSSAPLPPCSPAPLLVRIPDNGALPFRDAAFDAVISQHVVEHLPDVDAALRAWRRVLKPSGRLALATPNAQYPDPAHFADADHVRVFSARELGAAATRAGFVVESCYTLFPFLSRLRVLRAFGVLAHCVFQHAPYFATRGRTILLGARCS